MTIERPSFGLGAPPSAGGRGATVTLLGHTLEAVGDLPPSPQRVSDLLVRMTAFAELRNARIVRPASLAGEVQGPLPVRMEAVTLIIPITEEGGDPTERIEKRTHRVRLVAADWVVDGNVHLAAAADLEHYLVEGRETWIPVTSAVVTGNDPPRSEPVVLVRRSHVEMAVPLPVH